MHDKILVSRNCHKSVFNAIELNFLEPIYIKPMIDEFGIDLDISVKQVEEAFSKNPDIKLVVITSPTYEGVIGDVKKIAEIAHRYGALVLVDEAHGAHLNFVEKLKEYEALNSGADIVVQSLHKTLPALTQCAIMHIQGDLISESEVERALDIFETSSPSYVLMSSIDECLSIIEEDGANLFGEYTGNLKEFYAKTKELNELKILGNQKVIYDNGKIVIITEDTNITGKQLADILRIQYHIEVEMANVNYVIAMTSICDKKENFEKLLKALLEIDKKLECKGEYEDINKINKNSNSNNGKIKISMKNNTKNITKKEKGKEKNFGTYNFINYKEAEGKISNEYIWIYPPGIPIVAPGEIINQDVIEKLDSILQADIEVKTTYKMFPKIGVTLDRGHLGSFGT